jgi:hypothetical protein
MKIILSESQINKIILLTEVESVGFEIDKWNPTYVTRYTFIANKLEYYVDIEYEENNGYYYVSFDPKELKNNPNLDIKHLNTVLYTVAKIIEDFVDKNPNIEGLMIHAIYDKSRGETEDDANNIRTRLYARFIKQLNFNYKSYAVDAEDNRIYIDFK